MRSKLIFFVFVLLTLLLLPIGVKSRQGEDNLRKGRYFDPFEQIDAGDELKGNSVDSDYHSERLV